MHSLASPGLLKACTHTQTQSVASALLGLLLGWLLWLGRPRPPLGDVGLEVELALASRVVHEADLAKDGALRPAHVVRAHDRPGAADVPVGVAPVEAVLVVEEDGTAQR